MFQIYGFLRYRLPASSSFASRPSRLTRTPSLGVGTSELHYTDVAHGGIPWDTAVDEQISTEGFDVLHTAAVLVNTHRIHGAAIYGNIYHQIPPMLAYIPHMDPMGYRVI